MTVLSCKKILLENNTSGPNSIISLSVTHKALSDVSCLSEFRNLERLDLGFNNLTSIKDLKSCVNLKWLSVVQNKLQSLKGVESLTKLTVLNAGKNKLKSIDEAKSLASLRALILNDNEISSVCTLDEMKELNTLVLSRNPIRSLGESLVKVKSITKLSLSNCQLQTIDISLKSCLKLKELRLSHNEIMTIPSEFGHLLNLENLDMGNNSIINWSNLKVLSSLVHLRNLNLQGNPIAEKENLLKKVKKLLPNLQIFNARPIDKIIVKEVPDSDDFSVKSGSMKKRRELPDEKGIDSAENVNIPEKRKLKLQEKTRITNSTGTLDADIKEEKKLKHKKQRKSELANEPDVKWESVGKAEGLDKKSRKNLKEEKLNIIDSAESPFMDLFLTSAPEVALEPADSKLDHKSDRPIDAISEVVMRPSKKKKKQNRAVDPSALDTSQADEIGLGGPSAWDA